MTPLQQLHSITNCLLDAKDDAYGELFATAGELYDWLVHASGFNPENSVNREGSTLKDGKAIGLTWAAMCIKDFMRTKRFVNGLYQAVCDRLEKNKNKPVHILYAGTGPFATLVLPLTARFSSQQARFTLLEVNPESFDCLGTLVSQLQLEEYIHRIERADASTWILPGNETIDIFLCETMQQGLKTEPQVAIVMNLVPQLQADTVILPERVSLTVALIDTVKYQEQKLGEQQTIDPVKILDPVFTLDKEFIMQHATGYKENKGPYSFPPWTLDIPDNGASLFILTDITIYKNEKLVLDESALTIPLKIPASTKPTKTVAFQYQTGKSPGLRFEYS